MSSLGQVQVLVKFKGHDKQTDIPLKFNSKPWKH